MNLGSSTDVRPVIRKPAELPTEASIGVSTSGWIGRYWAVTVLPSLGRSFLVNVSDVCYGDGKADILWQNDSGQAAIWTMDGMNLTGAGTVGPNRGPTWHVKDAAEFNGESRTDIIREKDCCHE